MTLQPGLRAAALSSALGAMIVLGAQLAQAAAVPVSTAPMRYAALTHAPRVIRLRFSEAIVGKSSDLTLTDLAGHAVRVIPVKSRDDRSLEARIAGKLGEGVYMVHWTAVSSIDGSKTSGRYQFTVQ
jgi:methionine-rich copper-binding protein CopC